MALRLVHAIAGGIMRLAHVFEFGLDMAQLGVLFFQVGLRFFDIAEVFFLLVLCFVLPQQPQQFLLLVLIGLQRTELMGDRRLRLQLFQVCIQFAQDVLDADQVLARVVQTVFGFTAAFLVF